MKFYSILNKKTMNPRELNKVYFSESRATKFVKKLNSESKDGQEYCWKCFEYFPTQEEMEKYRVCANESKMKKQALRLRQFNQKSNY